jgi:hypothetical protein
MRLGDGADEAHLLGAPCGAVRVVRQPRGVPPACEGCGAVG